MFLYELFENAIKHNTSLTYLTQSESLKDVFKHLDEHAQALQELKDTEQQNLSAFDRFGKSIYLLEQRSGKEDLKP